MCFVLVHCCVDMLMTSCLWGATPILGRKRITLLQPYKQPTKSSICHTFIGFQRCTKIPINTDSLRVHRSVRPSLYPFYSQNCLHILSKVFKSTAKHPTQEVGVNQMWILKNSKELLEHLQSPNFNHITSIKSFDFSTLYTTIPHQKLKSRLATIIRNSFIHKNGNRRYKYLVLGRKGPYFVKEHSDSKNKYT